MSGSIQVALFAVCAVVLINILKSDSKEYSYLLLAAAGFAVLVSAMPGVKAFITFVKDGFSFSTQSYECVIIFFKCVLISQVCLLTKNYCKDSSGVFLSSCIDVFEKVTVLCIAMPLIKAVCEIITGFIGEK